jgi:subtilisin-like proprotein convertase family protein
MPRLVRAKLIGPFLLSAASAFLGLPAHAGATNAPRDLPSAVRQAAQHVLDAKRAGEPRARVLALSHELEQLAEAAGLQTSDVLGAVAPVRSFATAASTSAPAALLAPGCAEVQPTTLTFADTNTLPIPDAVSFAQTGWGTTKSHLPVAMPGTVWDVNLRMDVEHQRCNDLKIYLIAPSGRQITITTDNNIFGYSGIFNGTLWDDSVLVPATDYPYMNDVPATAVAPEGAFGAFIGEDPNGFWTLILRDDTPGLVGVLHGWSLEITTIPSLPAPADYNYFIPGPLLIPDGTVVGLSSTVAVSGLESYVLDVNVQTAILHNFPADLTVALIAPSGKRVILTSRNGGAKNNVFNGTAWDDSSIPIATDFAYVNGQVAPVLCPDGCLSAFIGEDPNGTWTLECIDDLVGDQGTLSGWTLNIVTCTAPAPGFALCSGDAADFTHVPCPCGNFGSPGNGCANSANAAGANLKAIGTSNPDTVSLLGSGMTATGLGLYMQHDAAGDSVFHDGVLCAGGTLTRLRTRAPVSGVSSFPNSTDTITLSVRGGVIPGSGSRRYYAIWYRNAIVTYCPPATANVTNGWAIDW